MQQQSDPWRHGAVMLAIAEKTPHGVLFVERGRHLRRHPGEIGLPGGGAEEIDAGDPVKTALRELNEELNIAADHVRVVGELRSVRQTRSQFIVTPVVGILDESTAFSIDGNEIVGVFAVPLASIIQSGAVYDEVELSTKLGRKMFAFDFEGRHIWGFTARILKSFVDAWNSPHASLRAAVEASVQA